MTSVVDTNDLYLNRRANLRVNFRSAVRFAPNPDRPLRLEQGVTQDVSMRGISLLTATIPQKEKPFHLWIPMGDDDVISATAHCSWFEVEDCLGDSPYWIRAGLTILIDRKDDRKMYADMILNKANSKRFALEETDSRVGFIF